MSRRRTDTPWVTASAVGQATFCPYQLYLARTGAARDAASERTIARGTDAHEAWNERQRRAVSGTAVAVVRLALAIALAVALGLLAVLVSGALGRP